MGVSFFFVDSDIVNVSIKCDSFCYAVLILASLADNTETWFQNYKKGVITQRSPQSE